MLVSVKLLGGYRQRLISLGEMRVLFPADKIYFFRFGGFSKIWGRLYNSGVFDLSVRPRGGII